MRRPRPARSAAPTISGPRPIAGGTGYGQARCVMALYLTRFSYTPETCARLTKNPEDRREAARKYIESVGGNLPGYWSCVSSRTTVDDDLGSPDTFRWPESRSRRRWWRVGQFETSPQLAVEETLSALDERGLSATGHPGVADADSIATVGDRPSGQAGAPAGTTPSCCIIVIRSMTPQCSRTRPSSANAKMSISWMSTALPVAGMPWNSPCWVPV